MEWKSLPSLLSSPDHYLKSFEVYMASFGNFGEYTVWLDQMLCEAVVSKLQPTLGEELQVLGVGGGNGKK